MLSGYHNIFINDHVHVADRVVCYLPEWSPNNPNIGRGSLSSQRRVSSSGWIPIPSSKVHRISKRLSPSQRPVTPTPVQTPERHRSTTASNRVTKSWPVVVVAQCTKPTSKRTVLAVYRAHTTTKGRPRTFDCRGHPFWNAEFWPTPPVWHGRSRLQQRQKDKYTTPVTNPFYLSLEYSWSQTL